jgi:hypothetical protein
MRRGKTRTLELIELAQEQLDVALGLFLSKRSFVSALTLAGAAEEIFGKALKFRGKKTALEYEYSVSAPVEEFLRRRSFTLKDLIDEKNRVRNAAKHMRDGSEAEVVADLEDEALWMLVRACENHKRLDFQSTPRMREFDDWFHEHVVGIKIDV